MTVWMNVIGWTLLHFLWQGALIAVFAALTLRLSRRAAPQARYAVASIALVAMLGSVAVTGYWMATGAYRVAEDFQVDASVDANRALAREQLEILARDTGGLAYDLPARAGLPSFAQALWRALRSLGEGGNAGPYTPSSRLPVIGATMPFVVGLWLCGVSILLLRLVGGWIRVRRLHRRALSTGASRWQAVADRVAGRLRLTRTVRSVLSLEVSTPMVLGWLRPVILLPVGALANLTPAQVEAILAHELAHIRRHDYLVNLLQLAAETLLFYHPAVWWLSARIRLEREHCCDDLAIATCGDRLGYAAALAELEAWRGQEEALTLAATGGRLLERVRRVLGSPIAESRRASGSAPAVALVALLLITAGGMQRLPALQPARISALVNVNQGPSWKFVYEHASGRFTIREQTARELIRLAYNLDDPEILGGPAWLDSERFTLIEPLGSDPIGDELPALIQRLLAARFGLTTHVEQRDFPVYALIMAEGGSPGPQLTPSSVDCTLEPPTGVLGLSPCDSRSLSAWDPPPGRPAPGEPRQRRTLRHMDGPLSHLHMRGVTMAHLAAGLTERRLDRDVIDATGLPGSFDVDLDYLSFGKPPSYRYILSEALDGIGLPSLPTALREQLGLALREADAPKDVLVIDAIERPAGD
jgi:uncharacterized protein (TIGR03435 family)